MRSRMIMLAAGLTLAMLQAPLIPLSDCIFIALLMLFSGVLKRSLFRSLFYIFLSGLLYATLWGHVQLSQRLPEEMVRTDWLVRGVVAGQPEINQQRQRFEFKVQQIEVYDREPANIPRVKTLRLSWYDISKALAEGDRLEMVVRLKPPHTLLNPAAFDYQRWLLARGVDATGYVREMRRYDAYQGTGLIAARKWVKRQLNQAGFSDANRGLLLALAIGDSQEFEEEHWALLRHSGTVHLAVISGLHIGFMALLGWWLGKGISVLCFGRGFLWPYLGALLAALSYLFLSGAGLPAQRAFIMLAVLLLGAGGNRYISHWDRWWLALVVVILFNPLSVFEVGFWLSFTAVGWLIYLAAHQDGWKGLFKLQVALMIGMLPLYLQFFSGVSLAAPFINLLAIPLFAILVPMLALHLCFALFDLTLLQPILTLLADLFWWLTRVSASQAWLYQSMPALKPVSALFLIAVLIIMLSPGGLFPRWLAFPLLLPIVFGVPDRGQEPDYEALVFDVGQGLSVLVSVGDYHLLYDTGPGYPGGNSFQHAVLPYLRAQGITRIDDLVLSHDDRDHNGGFGFMTRELEVRHIYSSYDTGSARQSRCDRGVSWQQGKIRFRFLHGNTGRNDNDRSCVLLIQGGDCTLLLPGDVSGDLESGIAASDPVRLDWLVAAHHGSQSSTTAAALRYWQPETVIFSSGYANPFGHPHPEIVERVKRTGAFALNTAVAGAIRLKALSGEGCLSTTFSEQEKRFWR